MVFDKIFGALSFSSGGSSSSGTAFEMIAVIVLTILIAYIVGVMISHIVDRKLGDIEIQMPKIHVNTPPTTTPPQPTTQTPPQIVFRISEDADGKINFQPVNEQLKQRRLVPTDRYSRTKETGFTHPNRIQTMEPFLSVDFEDAKYDDVTSQTPTLKS